MQYRDDEPDHAALIRDALPIGVDEDAICGLDPDDHDWTSEGEGGCDENPGVWALGGTTYMYQSHCTRCGLQRREIQLGSQRHPDESDTVEYFFNDEDEDA